MPSMSGSTAVSNTGEVDEEFLHHRQLQYHTKPLPSSSPEMGTDGDDLHHIAETSAPPPPPPPPSVKKKRSLPGTPDPSAEVIALSPKTLMATNRFVCEICHKGFQRDQNLQLHRRGHNLPWKLRQRGAEVGGPRKRVYVCPEPSCVHHNPSRALGDLTGIKKHFCRKHGEKKWKCERCGKKYAVHSDWKAHSKVCGTREYKCDCGTVFSRRDSFMTHRAFCDALAQENNKLAQPMNMATVASSLQGQAHHLMLPAQAEETEDGDASRFGLDVKSPHLSLLSHTTASSRPLLPLSMAGCMPSSLSSGSAPSPSFFNLNRKGLMGLYGGPSDVDMGFFSARSANMSATALLQKAAEMGTTTSSNTIGFSMGLAPMMTGPDRLSCMSPFRPMKTHGPYDGLPLGQTQLVGFDVGGLSSQFLNGDVGAMPRAIGSLMSVGHPTEHRQADDVQVVDYMGVDDQRSLDGLNPFGPHMGPWA